MFAEQPDGLPQVVQLPHLASIDVDEVLVTIRNLRFVVGDLAERCFEPEALEAILNSSVLHHLTSFNGYDPRLVPSASVFRTRQGVQVFLPGFVLAV